MSHDPPSILYAESEVSGPSRLVGSETRRKLHGASCGSAFRGGACGKKHFVMLLRVSGKFGGVRFRVCAVLLDSTLITSRSFQLKHLEPNWSYISWLSQT